VVIAFLAVLVLSVAPAQAATFTVTNLNDSGAGSLRQAILDANALRGADTITFAAGLTGRITLDGPAELVVNEELTIQGPGAGVLILDGDASGHVLVVSPGVLARVSGLALTGGSGAVGGAIVNAGILTVSDAVFAGNSAQRGGAIGNVQAGELTVERAAFYTNSASEGSAIHNANGARIFDSTFMGNSGSAALVNTEVMNVIRSTFAGNVGGITSTKSLIASNSTFVMNTGIGAISASGAPSSISANTIVDNPGGGIQVGGPFVFLSRSIVTNNFGRDCSGGTPQDGGGNLTSPFSFCPGLSADPPLDPSGVADNGGPTQTIALTPESPAIDAFAPPCHDTDQRGVVRPQGAGCDIGAFELEQAQSPEELIEDVLGEVAVLAGSADPMVSDKAEDARDKLDAALSELAKSPPDGAAALGALEGAAGELEAMVDGGLLTPTEGETLLDALADAARLIATDAIDAAAGGDTAKLAEANQALADGDTLRDDHVKETIGKYKDAFSKAESA
jgi:hypothetical protein